MVKLIKFDNILTKRSVFVNPDHITHVFTEITYNERSRPIDCIAICLTNSIVLKVEGTITSVLKKLEEE